MKQIKYVTVILAAMCLLSDCITPYDLKIEGFVDLLVVEGVIVDGETTIKLSRSMPLSPEEDEWAGARPVSGAGVWIEGENGDHFDAVESYDSSVNAGGYRRSGEYIASDVRLTDDVRYRLRITSDGEEYESDWRFPQATPPIESIDFHLKSKNGPVQVRFNVNGEADRSRYYLWSYEENWEIRAPILATHYYAGPDPDRYYSLQDYMNDTNGRIRPTQYPNYQSPYFYCWDTDKSNEILLASTDLLTVNTLKDHVLYEIDIYDKRIAWLYHTKIFLYSIGSDAYYYYSNQKNNADEAGSIFAPIPSEMMGNIVSTTSPDVPVIGFVDVSRRVSREIFLHENDSPYRPTFIDCTPVTSPSRIIELEKNIDDFFLYEYDASGSTVFASYSTENCIDCRISGGTKNRPSWWPNNHY